MLWFMRRRRLLLCLMLGGMVTARAARASSSTDDDNFRKDVVMCEEALAALNQCCPGFQPKDVRCTYLNATYDSCSGSGYERISPALDEAESACVLATPCASLRESGVCARAQKAVDYESSSSVSDGDEPSEPRTTSSSHPPVCP